MYCHAVVTSLQQTATFRLVLDQNVVRCIIVSKLSIRKLVKCSVGFTLNIEIDDNINSFVHNINLEHST